MDYIPIWAANGMCNWASIAGIVTRIKGEALNDYGVQINDAENPNGIQDRVYSGGALTFGDGGFELVLGGAPVVQKIPIIYRGLLFATSN